MRNLARNIWHLPRKAISELISLYQHTLSPDHGPLKGLYPYGYCRHEPTCSVYCKEVVEKRGVVLGIPLSLWRILSCNPFAKPSEKKLEKLASEASQ
ncbi:membrane protein insertion efficiency factor YidD [Candidatus Peregrinibacteria bacterium]|nr:membrane protein insertion efficiency factor YidD [Candidatus Peregrinibacteria bacterium]MBT5468888.1 membrane protein insertion efficiency factor YidD [Candidatus Peregrinibacteria bacterium]MBT7337413.1 membrane protein insertion efficiency factor YidD [Candidatus Peregrinibacteria bacterium]